VLSAKQQGRKVVQRSLVHFLRRHQAAAFRKWRSFLRTKAQKQSKLEWVARKLHMKDSTLKSQCFHSWATIMFKAHEKRRTLAKMVARVFLRVSFKLWRQFVEFKKTVRMKDDKESLELEMEEWKEKLRREVMRRRELDRKNEEMQAEIETMRKQYLAESVDRSDLVQRRRVMEAELEKLRSIVEQKSEMVSKLEKESIEVRQLHKQESMKVNKMQNQLSQRDEYVKNLCGALRKAEEERDSLQAELARNEGISPVKGGAGSMYSTPVKGTPGRVISSYTTTLEKRVEELQLIVEKQEEEKHNLVSELHHVSIEGVSPEKVAPHLREKLKQRDAYVRNLCLALRKAEDERDALREKYER